MASDKSSSNTPLPSNTTSRLASPPPPGLRQRPLGRAATFAENTAPMNRRRSSFISDTFSETKRSLRSSTDDLLLTRAKSSENLHHEDDSSHWHSLPLVLALMPAVGGLLFKDGSAIITDITLLGLAAIFLNWALRMPWDWYRGAQSTLNIESPSPSMFSPIDEEDETQLENGEDQVNATAGANLESSTSDLKQNIGTKSETADPEKLSAQSELRFHELAALFSCFVFPVLGAWLLHAIRSQLSRPSEGLVSNYNLTIFLLVAEIRPVSHLIKMVERRTLFLQRKVNMEPIQEQSNLQNPKIQDLISRVEDLETHVADDIAATESRPIDNHEDVAAKASAQASSDIRKSVQPELDALSRAMRRYEKRTTVSAIQIETRLQDLETRLKDVVALAAAVQRNSERQPKNYIIILTNWFCAIIVVPVQYTMYLLTLPGRLLSNISALPKRLITGAGPPKKLRDNKASRRGTTPRPSERDRRTKIPG